MSVVPVWKYTTRIASSINTEPAAYKGKFEGRDLIEPPHIR
jgi:hypothetical protein